MVTLLRGLFGAIASGWFASFFIQESDAAYQGAPTTLRDAIGRMPLILKVVLWMLLAWGGYSIWHKFKEKKGTSWK